MKFDVVVGNPPYQESGEARDEPVYHYFYNLAKIISLKYCLISPARFLFNAGQTPKVWNQAMLDDKSLKVMFYEKDSSKVFSNTDIKGGIAILYRDKEKIFGKIGTFTRFAELTSITNKVWGLSEISFSKLVSPQGIYRFSKEFFLDFPQAKLMQGKGTGSKIVSKSLNIMDFVFLNDKSHDENIKLIGFNRGQRIYKWIDKKYLELPNTFNMWKILVPESNGSGRFGETLSNPIIEEPLVGHSDTFLTIGGFQSKLEAENALKYLKLKFTRSMLGILKVTQHNSSATWQKVPLQDFTQNSDIDWSQSISEIDQQLYKKYGLSQDEIDFIETNVKAME